MRATISGETPNIYFGNVYVEKFLATQKNNFESFTKKKYDYKNAWR